MFQWTLSLLKMLEEKIDADHRLKADPGHRDPVQPDARSTPHLQVGTA
jgi:hypothetical protein